MRVRPISPPALADHLADLLVARPADEWTRVLVDGAPAAGPGALATDLVERLRDAGRPVARVSADDFWRPASVRLEHGREDPDAFYDDWVDHRALAREVLDPLAPGGTGRYLPSLWEPVRDRATRASYADAPQGTVLLLDGALLMGRWLDVDLTVHLTVSPAALRRRTPADLAWTLPAYARYEDEVAPADAADLVVRMEDPRHPALVVHDS